MLVTSHKSVAGIIGTAYLSIALTRPLPTFPKPTYLYRRPAKNKNRLDIRSESMIASRYPVMPHLNPRRKSIFKRSIVSVHMTPSRAKSFTFSSARTKVMLSWRSDDVHTYTYKVSVWPLR